MFISILLLIQGRERELLNILTKWWWLPPLPNKSYLSWFFDSSEFLYLWLKVKYVFWKDKPTSSTVVDFMNKMKCGRADEKQRKVATTWTFCGSQNKRKLTCVDIAYQRTFQIYSQQSRGLNYKAHFNVCYHVSDDLNYTWCFNSGLTKNKYTFK